jgi:hypothetical protein
MKNSKHIVKAAVPGGGPFYFFGWIGAVIYYVSVAHGFWGVVVALLKSVVWPAFLTHDLLNFIAH